VKLTVPASIFSDFWDDQLVANGNQYLFMVLVGFVGAFAFIRMSTRLMRSPRVPWWPGSVVSDGGLHVHHLVFGIVLMMIAGSLSFAGFAESPWYEILALLFGIGVGLTIDEFALFLYLEDVYWAKEGRTSVDATIIAVGLMGLVLVGMRPVDVDTSSVGEVLLTVVGVAIYVGTIMISFLKGRVAHGTAGFLVNPLALYATLRLGKPGSYWARRFYGERNPNKQARAEARFHPGRRTDRFKERLRDLVGGATEEEYEAKLAAKGETPES
jgi:hypothetical protein